MLKNIIIPDHRVRQVVSVLFDRWSETTSSGSKRSILVFGKYVSENEGMYGCYAVFCVNGIVYVDHEQYGQFNSSENLMLVCQVLEVQTTWCDGDYKKGLSELIK